MTEESDQIQQAVDAGELEGERVGDHTESIAHKIENDQLETLGQQDEGLTAEEQEIEAAALLRLKHDDAMRSATESDDVESYAKTVKVIGAELQKRDGDAGYDLRAQTDFTVGLRPGCRLFVNTGLRIELPEGYAGLVLPRSGLARDKGVTLVNSPGLIDSSYRGEIGVTLLHTGSFANGDTALPIANGDRIAQLVIVKVSDLAVVAVDELSETERGEDGFGSTGVA